MATTEQKLNIIFKFGSFENLDWGNEDIKAECRKRLLDYEEELDNGRMTPNDVRMAIVTDYPDAIALVRNQTKELCEAAVRKDGLAIRHIKNPSNALCAMAIEQNPAAFTWMPLNLRRDFCDQALRIDGLMLEHISEQTEELCIAAVLQNPAAMWFVDDRFADAAKKALAESRK